MKLLLQTYFFTAFLFTMAKADMLNDIEINNLSPNARAELVKSEWSKFTTNEDPSSFHLRTAENRQRAILTNLNTTFKIINSPIGIACARGVKSRRLLTQILETDDELEKEGLIAKISVNGESTFENYTSSSTKGWRGKKIIENHQKIIATAALEYGVDPKLIKSIMMLETSLRGWPSYYMEAWLVNSLFNISSALPMNIKSDRWGPLISSSLDYTNTENNIRLATALLKEIQQKIPENNTIANLASIYNFIGAERTSCYGHLVNWIYTNELWQ